jgi:hypothetical protein
MRIVWWIALTMYVCQVVLFAVAYPDELSSPLMREQTTLSPHRAPDVFRVSSVVKDIKE